MAEGKDIKIGIKTTADTSGAKAAEEAIKKVGQASDQAEGGGFGRDTAAARRIAELEAAEAAEAQAAAMAKVVEVEEEMVAGLEELKTATEEYAEAADEATTNTGQLDENVGKIARAQKAAAVADLAQKVGLIGDKFKEAAREVRQFDEETADRLENTGDQIQRVTGAVSQLALGFAVGGPIGAGVAALAILVGSLTELFMEQEIAAAQAAAKQREALLEVEQAVRSAKAAEDERRAAMESDAVLRSLNAELSALEKITVERRVQSGLAREKRRLENEVLQAEDQAALAEIDRDEAAGKITGPEAETKRADIEAAARKRARETRKGEALEEARLADEEAKAKADAAAKARAAADEIARQQEQEFDKAKGLTDYFEKEQGMMVPGDPANAKFLDDIGAEMETARKILADLEAKRQEAEKTAAAAAAESESASGTADAKRESAGAIVSAVDRAGEAQERGLSARGDIAGLRSRERRTNEEASIGRDAQRLIPKDAEDALRDGVNRVAKNLQDGDQGGEIGTLLELVNMLAGAVEQKDGKAQTDIAALRERLKRLEAK